MIAVGTVSNEEMQEIWAKLLASEINAPKSISYKTIELLKKYVIKRSTFTGRIIE